MTKSDNLQIHNEEFIDEQHRQLDELTKRLDEYKDFNLIHSLDNFSMIFYQKRMIFDNKSYPLGSFSTAALNFVRDFKLKAIQPILKELYQLLQKEFSNKHHQFSPDAIKTVDYQLEKINAHLDSLIVFNDVLNIKNHLATAQYIYSTDNENSDDIRTYVAKTITAYIQMGDALISFYEHMYRFSKTWITDNSIQFNHDYASAFHDYFDNEIGIDTAINQATFFPTVMYRAIRTTSEFQPIKLQDTNQTVFGEIMTFSSYLELLHYDYFKSLQNEHTVRVCRNCKRAFLQTTKHHTVYCDQVAPGYKNKTCRDVGALNIQKEKVESSPIHQLYKRCYKKLNQRYNRKRISLEQFNELVNEILSLKTEALDGRISVLDYESLLNDI